MVTDLSVYLMEKDTFKLLYYVKIEYLVRIIQMVSDPNVFALNFEGKEVNRVGSQAFLFDSARRSELIFFI